MRVVVTGGTGFLGRHIISALLARGDGVVAAARRRGGLPEGAVWEPIGDIGPATDWGRALAGADAVIHAAGRAHATGPASVEAPLHRRVGPEGNARLAEEAKAAGIGRIVYVSTAHAVATATSGRPLADSDPPQPDTLYGRLKLEAERALLEAARAEVVILRPPLVIGAGARGNLPRLVGLVRRGVPLPLAGIANRRSIIAAADLAAAALAALDRRDLLPGAYLVAGATLSTAEMVRLIADALGRRPRLFALPRPLLAGAGRLLPELGRLTGDLDVDDGRFRAATGWAPAVSPAMAFAEAVAGLAPPAGGH